MEAGEFLVQLKSESASDNREAVEALCETMALRLNNFPAEFTVEQARETVGLLRDARFFPEFLNMTVALRRWFNDDPLLKRQNGQALIENDKFADAIEWLTFCEPAMREEDEKEWGQMVGLLGRTHKQLYFENEDPVDLQKALDWYNELYQDDQSAVWHGINVVCLAALAHEKNLALSPAVDYRLLAKNILIEIKNKPLDKRDYWDEATIAEALIALNRPADALKFIKRYCGHKDAGAFAIAGTLRQFDDFWQLDEREGDIYLEIIDTLRSALMHKEGGRIVTGVDELAKISLKYEKRFTAASPLPRTWFLQLIDCSNFVGRIWHKTLFGCGTGFLITDGGELNELWRGHQIFVTCNHLVSGNEDNEDSLLPNEVTITFDSLDRPGASKFRHTVQQVLWESPREDLDVTILQLSKVEDRIFETNRGKSALDILKSHSRMPSAKTNRIYIIGHPGGEEMSFSFQDNQFIARNKLRIQYITPTDPGSSGSPVFDQHLNLIAMHHAGGKLMDSLTDPGESQKANQGIPIPAIIDALAADG